MRYLLSVFLAFLIQLPLSFAGSFASANDSRVMFVLDGSNSMWGQIDGVAKISIAKEVMADLITDWDEAVPVGLVVYGHRRKDDCSDIEMVAKPGKVNRKYMIDKVKSIKPRGKTPITESLIQAAFALNSSKGKASVVLVSDGLETCNADPCGMAYSLNLVNPGFDVHVVGFDVNEEESKALQCIAERSGGQFLRANNADQLKEALAKTVTVAAAPKPAPVPKTAPAPEAKPVPAKPQPSMFLYSKFCESCDRLEPGKTRWRVMNKDGSLLYDGLGVLYPRDPEIGPGTYQVTVRYESGALVRNAELMIGADGKQVGEVNLNGGSAQLFAFATDDKTIAADPIFYEFFPVTNGKVSKKALTAAASSNALTWLPAGHYQVVAKHGKVDVSADITIVAGENSKHDFDMRVGYFQPEAFLSAGGPKGGGSVDYEVYANEADARARKSRIVLLLGSQKLKYPLRPGDYFARATVTYQRKTPTVVRFAPFSVTSNEVSTLQLDLNVGLLSHKIKSKSGKGVSNIQYVRESDGKRIADYYLGGSNILALSPGRYRLRIFSGGQKLNSDSFEIVAGKKNTVNITIP